MNARNPAPSSVCSSVRDSTSSHTTASEGKPGCVLLGPAGAVGELRVDEVERDRPLLGDLQLLEVVDDHARVLAGHVGQDHVALGLLRHAREVDHVADRALGAQQVERLLRGLLRWRGSAGGSSPPPPPGRARAPGARRRGSASCPWCCRSMKTCRSSPSASTHVVAQHLDVGGHAGVAQPADRGAAARPRRRSGPPPGSGPRPRPPPCRCPSPSSPRSLRAPRARALSSARRTRPRSGS